jgi:hypothetical protein
MSMSVNSSCWNLKDISKDKLSLVSFFFQKWISKDISTDKMSFGK